MARTSENNSRRVQVLENDDGTKSTSGWKCVIGMFIVQFLLLQLVFSYGVYSVYSTHEEISVMKIIWAPVVFLCVWKISSPWCHDIAESFSEGIYFRPIFCSSILLCSLGVSVNVILTSFILRAVFYGGFGGFGSCLALSLVQSRLFNIFQYHSPVLYSIQHLCTALGLFITPHLINLLFNIYSSTRYVFLIHGAIILHAVPASFLLGPADQPVNERLSKYNTWCSLEAREEELVDANNIRHNHLSRNWRCPSEKQEIQEICEELEYETPPPQKCTMGVDVLPEIPEENEENEEEGTEEIDKNKLLNIDIKRLSVISSRLEGLIAREETMSENQSSKAVTSDMKNLESNTKDSSQSGNYFFRNMRKSKPKSLNYYCCSPYQKFRYRRRLKICFDTMIIMIIKPIITCFQISEFYPCLMTVIHSMLSPLIFLNFTIIKASRILSYGNMTEVSFMLSITAFAYICFLITLPWITEISKRNLRYLYIIGLITSAMAVYLITKNNTIQDYMTISCLVYGFGFGIESYCQEIVIKEYLGVKYWSKTEGTLNCLSGILLLVLFIIFSNIYILEKRTVIWYYIIFYSHLITACLWIIFPFVDFIFRYIKTQKRNKNRHHFLQQET